MTVHTPSSTAPPILLPPRLSSPHTRTPTLLSLKNACEDVSVPTPSKKRKISSIFNSDTYTGEMGEGEPELFAPAIPADTAENVKKGVGPFLSKHIPEQYAPQGPQGQQDTQQDESEKGNTKYCYRHRPDIKCRRQADEPTMEQLQKQMETLPAADQQAISHVWSLFSAAPATHRNMMLQGILAQCCFPQLSFISAALSTLIRIDFLTALPPEIAFKVLCYLDTASLCKAAQVSHRWRMLADDDVVWHKMCEQHIDRKCEKCGWGLPLLERKRLRATKRQMELRAREPGLIFTATVPPPSKTRPWKDVYSERYKVESNWRRGRCTKKVFQGHSDGIMCLQFDDNMLATGSYDRTIKIWDIESGEEIRTLAGHDLGVRALMFDDQKLISGSLDKSLKIWNWRTGECISTLRGHAAGVICVHFDENLLASGSIDKTIKIWNFADKSCFALKGHTDWVNSVRLDSGSRTIFSASDDQTVRMWDLDTKACTRVFEGHVGHVQQVIPLQLNHQSQRGGAAAEGEGSPSSPPSLTKPQIPPSHQHPTHPLEEYREANVLDPPNRPRPRAPPPKQMITAALDSQVKFWDVATGKCTKTLFGHVEGVWALAADSLRVISGAQDRMVKVWDVRTGRCQRTITGHSGPVTCVGLGDSKMVTGGEDGEARLYCFKSEGSSAKGWTTPPEMVGSSNSGSAIAYSDGQTEDYYDDDGDENSR
ncbi:WD40-repeat-containing domain protein [Tuber borchii]|uniref:WD40-repeat-containing domain protein n=1 Tax=Tuber borchii TaxID=42251 RepID=A0A2T7A8J5_TUBBO|nr:WD40-repeat-containing domain protein [Tuber borchii]